MSLKLYVDVHVRRAIVAGLKYSVDVLTAQEDGTARYSDSDLLERATSLSRVLFSQDKDLLREAAFRQESGIRFSGLIYAHQLRVSVGQCIRDLRLLAETSDPEGFVNRVEYLPLK